MGMTLAEKSFRQRTKEASAPYGYLHVLGGRIEVNNEESQQLNDMLEIPVRMWSPAFDLEKYRKAFEQYGAYLELIGGDGPAERHIEYTFVPAKFEQSAVEDEPEIEPEDDRLMFDDEA